MDPICDFALTTDVYHEVGRRAAALGRQLVILQEGGYHRPSLGENVRAVAPRRRGPALRPDAGGRLHARRHARLRSAASDATYHPATMSDRRPPAAPATDDLPEHVRKLVHEIESEIGEDGEEPRGAPGAAAHGGPTAVEQAVRDILSRSARTPSARACSARRSASTACTTS